MTSSLNFYRFGLHKPPSRRLLRERSCLAHSHDVTTLRILLPEQDPVSPVIYVLMSPFFFVLMSRVSELDVQVNARV